MCFFVKHFVHGTHGIRPPLPSPNVDTVDVLDVDRLEGTLENFKQLATICFRFLLLSLLNNPVC